MIVSASSPTGRRRCTGRDRTCATGCMSPTTARPSTFVVTRGRIGEVYNIGGHNEMRNIDIVRLICRKLGKPESLITYVADRQA